jgi:hypothetical protein
LMPYREKPEFRDENERIIWCTAFATHPILVELRDVPMPSRPWAEFARVYADKILAGYRDLKP